MSIKKKVFIPLIVVFLGGVFISLLVNLNILQSTEERIFEDVNEVPESQAAMILGARVLNNGVMSDILMDRVIKAKELYDSGKVGKILISGDHGQNEYDEVNTVKNYLLSEGVPSEDIFMDHAGFDTYDSLYRAKAIFEVESLIVVTQEFHLPRAVYIGEKLGMEVNGYIADRQPYLAARYNSMREFLARNKAFLDLLIHAKPKYLGEVIPITGSGELSWD